MVASTAGPDYVAVTDGTAVELVDADGHVGVELDAPVTALAADGTRTYCLCDSVVTAVSRGGAVAWRIDVPGSRTLSADPGGTLVVATGDGELVALDADAGTERFRVPQPHRDVAGTPSVTCLGDRVVVASWSFVTVLDRRGETLVEASVDGAAESVASLGEDLILVATKDGRLVCLDDGGTVAWEHRADVSWLAETGDAWVAAVLDDEDAVVAVAADGTVEVVHDRSGSAHAAAADGGTVCVVRNGTLVAYRRAGGTDAISVTFGGERLVPGEALLVEMRNEGDDDAVATVSVDADGATFGTAAFDATLDAGEHVERLVDVVSVDADRRSVDAWVTLDGERAAEATLEVAELSNDPVAVDAVVRSVSEGRGNVEVTVRNDSREPLTRVGVDSPGSVSIPPGRAETLTVRRPLPVDRVTVVGRNVDVDAPVESELEEPSVTVRGREDGWFDVTVANEADAPLTDVLRVDVSATDGTEPFPTDGTARPIDLPPRGTFVLAHPAPGATADERTFEVTASLEGVAASAEGRRVCVSGLAVGAPGRHVSDDQAGPGSVRVDRSFGGTATAGAAFVERFVVENDGDHPVEPTVAFEATDETPSERIELDALEPGEATTVTRRYAAWGRDVLSLAAGHVAVGDRRLESFDAVDVPVESNALAARLWAPLGASALDIAVRNDGERPRLLTRVAIRGARNRSTVDEVVDPGARADLSVPLAGRIPDDSVRAAVEHAPVDAPEETAYYETLVARVDRPRRGVDVATTVSPETDLTDGYGEVVLRFANESDATLDSMTVEATGEAPDEYLYYGAESFESVEPGGTVTHRVDVDAGAGGLSLPVAVTVEAGGESTSEVVVVEAEDGSLTASRRRADPSTRPLVLVSTTVERSENPD